MDVVLFCPTFRAAVDFPVGQCLVRVISMFFVKLFVVTAFVTPHFLYFGKYYCHDAWWGILV